MSHVSTVAVEVTDLDALRSAAVELGAEWLQKSTYEWYGQSVGDYPIPKGMTAEMLGKSAFVIHVPGVRYEIGVVKMPGGSYTLAYDFFGNDPESFGARRHDGQRLLQKFGDKCQKLVQGYAKHAVMNAMRRKGKMVSVLGVNKQGQIQLRVSGY